MKAQTKWFLWGMALAIACGQMAVAAPELKLIAGGSTTVLCDGTVVTGCAYATGATTYTSTSFGNWALTVVVGESNSPGGDPLLDLGVTAQCSTGNCQTLNIFLSDVGFTMPVALGGFTQSQSPNDNGIAGTVTQDAWAGTGYFSMTSGIGNPLTASGTTHVSASGGPAESGSPSYSLTLEDTISGANGAHYSLDGTLFATPEPSAFVLFGTILVLCGSRLWRKRES